MIFRLTKKKNDSKIKVSIEDEIDISSIKSPLIDGVIYSMKEGLTNRIVDAAIDKWLYENGSELFDKFDTDDALKLIKKKLLDRMFDA